MSSSSSVALASKKRERAEEEIEIIDVSKRAKVAENQAPSSTNTGYPSSYSQPQSQQYHASYPTQTYAQHPQAAATPYNYNYPTSYAQYDYNAAAYAQYYAQQAAYAPYAAASSSVAVATDPSVDPLAYPGEKPKVEEAKEAEENKNLRRAAGKVWEDNTMSDWPDNDFRIHVGNLGPDVDDRMLHDAFKAFPTLAHWRVIMDKRYDKSKGYGFVSFLDPREGVKALKAMNGKYIGSRAVKVTKSTHEKRSLETTGHGKKR